MSVLLLIGDTALVIAAYAMLHRAGEEPARRRQRQITAVCFALLAVSFCLSDLFGV